jgi:hypothetical protein
LTEILEFMKTADIGIEDFVVSKETAEEAKISDEMKGAFLPNLFLTFERAHCSPLVC